MDYRQCQILTSFEHVDTLKDIASKKHEVQQKKEERTRLKERTKDARAQEKVKKVQEIEARAIAKEAK